MVRRGQSQGTDRRCVISNEDLARTECPPLCGHSFGLQCALLVWFYGACLAFHLLAISFTWLLLDVPLTHPYRGAQAAMTSIHLVGMFTTRPAAHVWLAVSYIVVVVVSQAFFRLFPSGL